ncbi:unnamed protein product [Sphenostylis stenocarpa]|uniref:Uncharacterized protein n=1 Tax=Sphenostylis stenocarpa TaxID=92480 RepID=A0AA86W3P8_9FABA|nr:unnamed protein product [Sphenostylis stenocarpa]
MLRSILTLPACLFPFHLISYIHPYLSSYPLDQFGSIHMLEQFLIHNVMGNDKFTKFTCTNNLRTTVVQYKKLHNPKSHPNQKLPQGIKLITSALMKAPGWE